MDLQGAVYSTYSPVVMVKVCANSVWCTGAR